METAEQSAAEEQIQAEITFREELIESRAQGTGASFKDRQNNCLYAENANLRIVGKEILDDEDTFWVKATMWMERTAAGSVRGKYYRSFGSGTNGKSGRNLRCVTRKSKIFRVKKSCLLKKLYLSKNMITDFSVLLNLIDLDALCIMENPAESVSDWKMHRHFKD